MTRNDVTLDSNTRTQTDEPEFPGRQQEYQDIIEVLEATGSQHGYIYGPRGSGKTAVTSHALDAAETSADTVYLSCMQHDTQYKVFQELCDQLTGESIEEGHHTATLKHEFESILDTTAVAIVLDEADFLLANDGNDLLYYLSRVSAANPVSTVSISANHPELASLIDTRTYSSLQPHHIAFDGYSEDQAHQILHTHTEQFDDAAPPVYPQAIEQIATTTTNIRFGMHWLRYAMQDAQSAVSKDEVNQVHGEAIQRYRDVMLQDFTPHHSLLLEAIYHLCNKGQEITFAGDVYTRYNEFCTSVQRDPLTNRRLSDFLTHLDLLGLIEAEYHRGGEAGKTREIQLVTQF